MSEGREVDEIAQQLGRTGAAVLSAALVAARIAMQRRAERAEAARQADERRQQEAARELHAERQLAAVGWERVNLRQWFRENPQEVAETWASAATWAEQDPRAKEAFESLNLHLDHLGAHDPEVRRAAFEANGYRGLAGLLKQGADEAYSRLTSPSAASKPDAEAVSAAPAEEAARWERVGVTRQFDSARQLGDLWAAANTWAPYDASAAETLASLNTTLARHNVRMPRADEVEPVKSPALAQLLDNGATQAARHAGPEGDFVRFGAWYIRDPANALASLNSYLTQVQTDQPGYYRALREAAGEAGADHNKLTTWFAQNLDVAYAASRDHFNPTPRATRGDAQQPTAAQASAQPSAQPSAPSSAPSSALGQIYQGGARASWLAGLSFPETTAASLGRGNKYRKTRTPRAARRVAARMARPRQEHGRG